MLSKQPNISSYCWEEVGGTAEVCDSKYKSCFTEMNARSTDEGRTIHEITRGRLFEDQGLK